MHKVKSLLIVLLFWLTLPFSQGQEPNSTITQDSIKPSQMENLQRIEELANNSGKVTRELHRLIFRPIKKKSEAAPIKRSLSYRKYEGKVIRNIHITTLDPFGFKVDDSLQKPETWSERFGNAIHVKTRNQTVRNLLLFKPYERLDSLIVRESERLVRGQRYIRRVQLIPQFSSTSQDSVDIFIRVLDSWSLIPQGSISSSSMNVDLIERNFIGTGHTFENNFRKNFGDAKQSYGGEYFIPNINNTFINSTIEYRKDLEDNTLKSFTVERTFFSPLTRWAGGLYFDERFVRDSLPDQNFNFHRTNLKSRSKWLWLGRSFQLSDGNSEEERTQRIITTLGMHNINYSEKPIAWLDPVNYYSGSTSYLATIGFNSRQFIEDRYLFEYDRIEDVPIGILYAVTGGAETKNNRTRSYFALQYAHANYYKFGYLGGNVEIGSYMNAGDLEQSALKGSLTYFTPLHTWGNWYFRHFIKPEFTYGFNRLDFYKDQLSLDGDNGIQGFNSMLLGNKKFTLSLQVQSYAPGIWYGFRFSPFLSYTCGFISDNTLFKSPMYSKIGVGVLISNDFLVFNQFQLSFAYYPRIPYDGDNILRTNSFKNSDFNLPNFGIDQPKIIEYK